MSFDRWLGIGTTFLVISHVAPARAEPAFSAEASAGLLLLERFDGDRARPKAWTYGATAVAHLQRDRPWGVGASVLLSQFDSFRAPCPPEALCSRSFHRVTAFAEVRWLQDTHIAWEPWFRAGPALVSAATAPESGEGDTPSSWAFAGEGRAGSDLRLRGFLLGAEGHALITTGSITMAWGFALHVGARIR